MKIKAAISSIECFHGRVRSCKGSQYLHILDAMRLGVAYTSQQLCHATGLTPNIIAGRLFELRDAGEVVRGARRKVCPISGVSVFVHRKLPKQMKLA